MIAIIGSGNVGGALAQRLLEVGEHVVVGVRFPLSEKSIKLATHIGEDRLTSIERAVAVANTIIITTPPDVVMGILPQLGDVHGKLIIDATNAVRTKPTPYNTVFEALKKELQTEQVVKCFNTSGFENMRHPIYEGTGIDLFMAGNHTESKAKVAELVIKMGYGNCYDFGGDDKVELLEQFALAWINLAIFQGHGRGIAVKIMKR